jgi:hypothetical protein
MIVAEDSSPPGECVLLDGEGTFAEAEHAQVVGKVVGSEQGRDVIFAEVAHANFENFLVQRQGFLGSSEVTQGHREIAGRCKGLAVLRAEGAPAPRQAFGLELVHLAVTA